MEESELLQLPELVVAALEGHEIFLETFFALSVEIQGNGSLDQHNDANNYNYKWSINDKMN